MFHLRLVDFVCFRIVSYWQLHLLYSMCRNQMYVYSASFSEGTWLVEVCDMACSYVWRDSCTCVTWLCMRVTWLIHMCDDLFVRVARLIHMGWLRSVGSIKSQVSLAEYRLFCRVLLQNKTIFLSILLTVATPYVCHDSFIFVAWLINRVYMCVALWCCVLQTLESRARG